MINSKAPKCSPGGLNSGTLDMNRAQQYYKKEIFIINDRKFTIIH